MILLVIAVCFSTGVPWNLPGAGAHPTVWPWALDGWPVDFSERGVCHHRFKAGNRFPAQVSGLQLSCHRQKHSLHPSDWGVHRPQVSQVSAAAPVWNLGLADPVHLSIWIHDCYKYLHNFSKKKEVFVLFFCTFSHTVSVCVCICPGRR